MVDVSLVQAQDVPAAAKVASHFASRILSGHYLPGDRLPSVRVGARELGVHYLTVAGAYRRLQGDGLVELRGRVGVFVRQKTKTAEYLIITGMKGMESSHVASLTSGLLTRVNAAGVPGGVRYCGYEDSQLPLLLDSLRGMIRERALRGAWVYFVNPAWVSRIAALMSEYSVPLLHQSSLRIAPYSVSYDTPAAVRAGTRELVERGCRRLARIAHAAEVYQESDEAFRATCEALDASYRIENRPFVPDALISDFERYGQAAATKLMSQPDRPDGLLITDDFIGRGALAALLRLSVRVPQDVRVCTHARRGDGFPGVYGLPVARMEADSDALAAAAFDLMERAVKGDPIPEPHLRLPMRLIPEDAPDAAPGASPALAEAAFKGAQRLDT